MKKQKFLIFSLSAMFFLAASIIVYSWTEPTVMPSSYSPPINTSATAQTKTGEIGASVFRDADDSNYYINPSGDSIISGDITTSGNVTTARPTEADQVTTKGYVDEQIALVRAIVSGAQTLVNGAHTWSECEAAGGTVVDSDVTLKQCRFEAAACPSGWNQYKNFSAADAQFFSKTALNDYCSCTTGSKEWSGVQYSCKSCGACGTYYSDVPGCVYYCEGGGTSGCAFTTKRTAIGCY